MGDRIYRRVFYWFAFALVLLGAVSCYKTSAKKDQGDILTIGYYGMPEKIDPFQTSSGIAGNLIDIIYDSLIDLTPNGKLKPRLAKSWHISPDGLTWTFNLHKGITFHDGQELTTEHVKFTFDKIRKKNGKSAYHNWVRYIEGISIIDKYTIKMTLKKYDTIFPSTLFLIGVAPSNQSKNKGYESTVEGQTVPVGSGPFRMVKLSQNQIILEANTDYFRGRPYLDSITIKFFPTQRANLAALTAGDVDMLYLRDPKDYGIIRNLGRIRTYSLLDKVAYMVSFNNRNPLFKDTRIRRALNYAINREILIKHLIKGKGSIISTLASPRSKNIDTKISPYDYNPKKTLKMLRGAGWQDTNNDFILDKNGRPMEFTLVVAKENDLDRKVARIVQQQLGEIGINIKTKLYKDNEIINLLFYQHNFEAAVFPFNLRYDLVSNYILWHSSQITEGYNFSSYHNPKVDHLLDIARSDPDEEKRRQAYLEFQEVIHDDPPGVFLFWRDFAIAIDKRFQGIPDRPFEFFKNLPNVWVKKSEQKH